MQAKQFKSLENLNKSINFIIKAEN